MRSRSRCVSPVAVLLATWLLPGAARADVTLPRLLSDHLVLQRERPLTIWGQADPGEVVTVSLRDRKASSTAGREGRWQVVLEPLDAGGPFQMTVAGRNTVVIEDVLVGDVWVCSGQSNMEWSVAQVSDAEKEVAQADHPRIRLFTVAHIVSPTRQEGVQGAWSATTPETVKDFSAVGYFFARELRRVRDVPIGLIDSTWGGTPAEAWTPPEVLASDPALQPLLWQWQRALADYPDAKRRYEQQKAEWEEITALAKAQGKELKQPPRAPRGPGHAWTPGGLFNGMIAPLTRLAIRGALWYQGESNAHPYRAVEYRRLFPALIQSWREVWDQGPFPFLFVQLANYMERKPTPSESRWAELREAQAMALAVPNTGMAVTIDIGVADDIHPRNKQDVGQRLALAARRVAYGEAVVPSGPLYDGVLEEGSRLRVRFRHVGQGLVAKGDRLEGFAVAGRDRRFVWAEARIDGETVVVSSPEVPHPVAVRYAWADNPACNLYNRDGLPASPFRSDDWTYPVE